MKRIFNSLPVAIGIVLILLTVGFKTLQAQTIGSPAETSAVSNLDIGPNDPSFLGRKTVSSSDANEQTSPDNSNATGTEKTRIPTQLESAGKSSSQNRSLLSSFISMAGALILVLGVFLGVVFCLKKIVPRDKNSLPSEIIGSVGRFMLTPKHSLYLVNFGPRLLLLSVTQEGVTPIAEITDPDEVEYFVRSGPKAFADSSSPLVRHLLEEIRDRHKEKKGESE